VKPFKALRMRLATSTGAPAVTTNGTLGLEAAGLGSYNAAADELSLAGLTTVPIANSTVSSLTVYFGASVTTGSKIRPVIYSDSGGVPGTLLLQGDETTLSSSDANTAKSVPFGSSLTLNANTKYWFGWISSGTFQAGGGAAGTYYKSNTYSSGAPSSAGSMSPTSNAIAIGIPFTVPAGVVGLWYQATSGTYGAAANEQGLIKVTMPAGGPWTPQSLFVRLWSSVTAGDKFKATIYSDSAGAPGNLLATGAEYTVSTADAHGEMAFTSPPTLTGGADYWIGVCSSGNTVIRSISGSTKWKSQSYASGPVSSFTSPNTSSKTMGVYLKFG
jgi:hypothetical protein